MRRRVRDALLDVRSARASRAHRARPARLVGVVVAATASVGCSAPSPDGDDASVESTHEALRNGWHTVNRNNATIYEFRGNYRWPQTWPAIEAACWDYGRATTWGDQPFLRAGQRVYVTTSARTASTTGRSSTTAPATSAGSARST